MPVASDVERRALLVQTTATVRGPVTLRVAPPRGQIGLRGDPAVHDFGIGIEGAIGLSLPTKPNMTTAAQGLSALWLGPDEWLILTPPDGQDEVVRNLGRALENVHASIIDLTDARAVIRVSGAKARELLAKGCPLDLHPRVFASGACAQSLFAKANIILHKLHADETFELYVARSCATYMWDWLEDAALEYRS